MSKITFDLGRRPRSCLAELATSTRRLRRANHPAKTQVGQGNWLRHRLSKGREIRCAPADSGVRAAQGSSPSSSLAELIWLVQRLLAKPRGQRAAEEFLGLDLG